MWDTMQLCWHQEPSRRPKAQGLASKMLEGVPEQTRLEFLRLGVLHFDTEHAHYEKVVSVSGRPLRLQPIPVTISGTKVI